MKSSKCFVSLTDDNQTDKLDDKVIDSHNFADAIALIVPEGRGPQADFKDMIMNDGDPGCLGYVYTLECKLKTLLSVVAIRNECMVLSKSRLDSEDVVSIHNRQLIISMTKDTFESTGIQAAGVGRASVGGAKRSRFQAAYDMSSEKFVPGNSLFDRLMWALDNTLTKPFVFTVYSPRRDISAEFEDNVNQQEKAVLMSSDRLVLTHSVAKSVKIPNFSVPETTGLSPSTQVGVKEEWAEDLFDWTALAALTSDRIKEKDTIDSYLSSYAVPDCMTVGDIHIYKVCCASCVADSGKSSKILVPPSVIKRIWARAKNSEWSALLVGGDENSPAAWNGNIHSYGDHTYGLFKLRDGNLVAYKVVCPEDL